MADLCTGKTLGDHLMQQQQKQQQTMDGAMCRGPKDFYEEEEDDDDQPRKVYSSSKLRCSASGGSGDQVHHRSAKGTSNGKLEDLTLDINVNDEDDCRKKRCVDRYDSSESSDSGVAILSCTDCSGSSTASSDITDPGSPFSTASSHSEDSASQPAKMPPTHHSVHHPLWPWSSDDLKKSNNNNNNNNNINSNKSTTVNRNNNNNNNSNNNNNLNNNISSSNSNNKQSMLQRQSMKRKETQQQQSTKCLKLPPSSNNNNLRNAQVASEPSPNKMTKPSTVLAAATPAAVPAIANAHHAMQMITTVALCSSAVAAAAAEAPKLQQGKITEYFKSQYKPSSSLIKKEFLKSNGNPNSKFSLVDAKKVIRTQKVAAAAVERQKVQSATRSVPRKILPAPTKSINVGPLNNFSPIITTTLIPNLYITKTSTKSSDNNIFVPQFTINDNKINVSSIPIVTRPSPCIIQPLQKITAINNFVKLNTGAVHHHHQHHHHPMPATIVKLNNYHPNVISAVPTAMVPKMEMVSGAHQNLQSIHLNGTVVANASTLQQQQQCSLQPQQQSTRQILPEELSPADSGVSVSSNLEVLVENESVSIATTDEDDAKKESSSLLKSPILSQPKTIRFPAKERIVAPAKEKISVNPDTSMCQWDQCGAHFETNGALLEHLQVKHVISQETQEQYVCLWQGCKVHGRKSCSRSWLERHVLAHAGTKPFRCIVDGCGQRFNSQLTLQRHVNGHFNTDSSQNGSTKKSVDNPSVKLYKRNGKKIRFRRQPWSARMFDFIDSGMMEGLQYKLLKMSERVTAANGTAEAAKPAADLDGQTLTVHSRIMAKRFEEDGTCKVLLKWHPADIIEDEWIEMRDYKKTRVVHMHNKGSGNTLGCFSNSNSSTSCSSSFRRKHRRKPLKLQQPQQQQSQKQQQT